MATLRVAAVPAGYVLMHRDAIIDRVPRRDRLISACAGRPSPSRTTRPEGGVG